MREIEIKLKVNNLEEIEKKLKDHGLVISKEITQHDIIYIHRDDKGDFTDAYEGHIALRMRYEGTVAKITLKQRRSNEMDNIEYETKVEDGEMMHEILQLLGWKPMVEVKKTRKKGKLGEYEICLDRVDKLGDFVELEKMIDDNADPEKIKNELFKELEKFGLSGNDEETQGYDTQIYLLKNK